ncbi:MAG: type II toxin-antitoxin system VapC family toxin [Cyanobacteria bacterium P01_A01_bin.123]
MNGWLLDTNIVSELRKPRCHPAVKAWSESQPPQSFYLSTITLAEIRFGICQVTDSTFAAELTHWIDNILRPWFTARILNIDEETILIWRQMLEQGRKRGYTFSQPDLFIAAIARQHNLCVATRNVKDLLESGVAVFNPFEFVAA